MTAVALFIAFQFGMSDLFAGRLISPVILWNSTEYPLAGHLEYVRDSGGRNSFRDVIVSPEKVRFQPLEGYLGKGHKQDAFWLLFSVKNYGKGLLLYGLIPYKSRHCGRCTQQY